MSFSRQAPVMPSSRTEPIPRFHIEPVQDEGASAAAGHPVFRDEERVEIILPGNPFTRPVKIVTDEHRQRWPREYAAFKAGTTMAQDGTPLEQWPMMTPAMVKQLKFLEIHTVEQCAALDDNALGRIPIGGRQIKNAAIAYLDDAASQKMTTELSRAMEIRDAENATLRGQVEQLGSLLEGLQREIQLLRQAPSAADTFMPGVPGFTPVQPLMSTPTPVSPLAGFQEPKRRGRPPGRPSEEIAAPAA